MSHFKRKWGLGAVAFLIPVILLGLDFPKPKTSDEPAIQEFRKGWMHLNVGELSLARDHFQKATAKKEDFHLAKFYLFQTYYKSGDWIAARNMLQELSQEKVSDVVPIRLEYLNLELANPKLSTQERVYYTSIQGDAHRGYRFRNPVDVAVDSQGNTYILGYGTTNLVSFNANLEPRWNTQGSFFQKLKGPVSLFLDHSSLYVLDFLGDAIVEFSFDGKLLRKIGTSGGQLGQFRGPTSLTKDKYGFLYVADSGNGRIQKFQSDWTPLFSFGNYGETKLQTPVSVFWHENELYVTDKSLNQILVYDGEGNFLRSIQSKIFQKLRTARFIDNQLYVTSESEGVYVSNPDHSTWTPLPSFRDKNGIVRKIDRPFGLTTDLYGYFYVADFNRNRIDIFTPKNYLMSNLNLDIEKVDVSDFPNVHIYFQVKNRIQQPITGLSRDDFVLYENENLKKYFDLTDLKKYNQRMTLAILYENSQELISKNELIREWFRPYFEGITQEDRIRLIRCGENTTTILNQTLSLYDITHSIRKSIPEESCNSGKSLYQTITSLSNELGVRNIIFLASGNDPLNTRQFNLSKIAFHAKANGIRIYPVVLNSKDIDDSWARIAEATGGKLYLPNQNAKQLYNDSMENKDYRYVLSYKTEVLPELKGRWIPLELQSRYRNFGGKTLGGYFVP